MRNTIATTIRYAASVVLAACAPTTATPDNAPADVVIASGDGTASTAAVAAASASTTADPVLAAPPANSAAAPNAGQAACQAYVQSVIGTPGDPRHKASPSGIRVGLAPSGISVKESVGGDGATHCHIVWAQFPAVTEVVETPTCCPAGRHPNAPCPKPFTTKVMGSEVLTESVKLDDSGERVSGDARWGTRVNHQPRPRHMCGRRPEGFAMSRQEQGSAANALATMAALEAASVAAFERLARELRSHGAPSELVARAYRAMHDEVRHAKALRRLAHARGATPIAWTRDKLPLRTQQEVALENAVEGCVREAYGAAVAIVQSRRAEGADVRDAFRVIGNEECEHAALAWDVHHWYLARASNAERAELAAAHRGAIADLKHSVTHHPSSEQTQRALGLPGPASASLLVEVLSQQFAHAA